MQASPSNGGTVSGSGSYAIGSFRQITANPNSGWKFTRWSDGITQNPRTITVPSGGATYMANLARQKKSTTSGMSVSNAVMEINNLAVAVAEDANMFTFDIADWGTSTLYYAWTFGDGDVSDRSTNSTPTHVYTNCGPYVASVTVDDGTDSTNASFTVSVACLLTVTKLQGSLNFAKTNADKCTVKGSIDLPPDYSFSNKLATVSVGDAEISFALDSKGRGRTGTSTFNKPSYNKTTGLWTLNAKLNNGSWQDLWAVYGLVNTNLPKPGVSVSLPVVLVIDDESFMAITNLQYTAKAGKLGTAK